VQFTLESTGNFDTWTPFTAGTTTITDDNAGTETVTVSGPAPVPARNRSFLRLRIGLQPGP
jgi:hypothetical protein